MSASDYVEGRKILRPKQEGFRADRSCARAIKHPGLCTEDTQSHTKGIVLCYLDFKGAFPSADHKQLVRTLVFFGLPADFITIISNLYKGATTEFVPPTATLPPSAFAAAPYRGPPLPTDL